MPVAKQANSANEGRRAGLNFLSAILASMNANSRDSSIPIGVRLSTVAV